MIKIHVFFASFIGWGAIVRKWCAINVVSPSGSFWLGMATRFRYGFGWFIEPVEEHRNVGHGGSTSGFSASIQRFPDDKLAVILLSNTDEQIATTLARHIAGFYFVKK